MTRTFIQFLSEQPSEMQLDSPMQPEDRQVSAGNDNPEDIISMDVPLFIRMMEYAREDASDDMALHSVVEKLTSMCADGNTLSMDDYDAIVGGSAEEQPAQPAQMSQENEETSRNQKAKIAKTNKIAQLRRDYVDKMRWSKEETTTTGRDRSGHMSAALKIKNHLRNQYGVEV